MANRKNEAAWVESRKYWRIAVQQDGARKFFYCSTPGRKGKIECERKADAWSGKLPVTLRMNDLWKLYEKALRQTLYDADGHLLPGRSTANLTKHEQIWRVWIKPRIGALKVEDITRQHYQNILDAAYREGRAKKTIKNIRATLSVLYKCAVRNSIALVAPEELDIQRTAPVGERKVLQPEQLRTLFAEDGIECYGRYQRCHYIHAWRMYVLTGMRRGELAGLRKEDIYDGAIHIVRSINSEQEITTGKNLNARRTVAISALMQEELDAQARDLADAGIVSEWVFPSPDGGAADTNSIYRTWSTYRQHYGIGCSIHELRHTMISILKNDMPLDLLKSVVGHSKSMDTLGTYGHEIDGEKKRAATLLDVVIGQYLQTK